MNYETYKEQLFERDPELHRMYLDYKNGTIDLLKDYVYNVSFNNLGFEVLDRDWWNCETATIDYAEQIAENIYDEQPEDIDKYIEEYVKKDNPYYNFS